MTKRIAPRALLSVEVLEDRLVPTGGLWAHEIQIEVRFIEVSDFGMSERIGQEFVINAPCYDPSQGAICGSESECCDPSVDGNRGRSALDQFPPAPEPPAEQPSVPEEGPCQGADPWGPLQCDPRADDCLPAVPKDTPLVPPEICVRRCSAGACLEWEVRVDFDPWMTLPSNPPADYRLPAIPYDVPFVPEEAPPVIDANALPACPVDNIPGGGHCLPTELPAAPQDPPAVLHEFPTLPSVVEDVTDVILNLKRSANSFDGSVDSRLLPADIGSQFQRSLPAAYDSILNRSGSFSSSFEVRPRLTFTRVRPPVEAPKPDRTPPPIPQVRLEPGDNQIEIEWLKDPAATDELLGFPIIR